MGGCVSLRSSSDAAADRVQVVHLNGHVQHFHSPITARQVARKPPPPTEYFICTAAQLVSTAASPALDPDAVLQPGKVYFILPFSTLHPDVSLADLASIARRLTAAAKSAAKSGSLPPCETAEGGEEWKCTAAGKSRQWRPLLDTIKEKPANSCERIESDLER
ncbi:DUF4228 domain-containing protein [Cucumis melo var. makuwa]|uniref:Uncharacterized protein LOC103499134 n=2 Tax=Cucumis melo TaxID=3656 RepID=A0A1S3CC70_CUCME|nr:uncharacterized protein LOC103499134 [Cucumis melo]KAA0031747.1 DUF4228 domain-containing protein [Cucumis melo var. makuwa]TYK08883.1 DUF4228 domain-containing protein [Cucumis melo var. makuwa]